jgi:hypothetical protein
MWRLYACIALCLGLAAGGLYYGHTQYMAGQADGLRQVSALKLSYAEALSKAQAAARKAEQDQAQRLDEVSTRYEQDIQDAQATADKLAARLRAGAVRLRDEWQCPTAPAVPGTAASSGESDDANALRERLAAAAIAVGAAADARARALQDALMAERQ